MIVNLITGQMTTCSSTSRSLETQDCQDSIFPAFYQVFERFSDHSQIVSHGMRHHRHRPTILSDCLIVISIKGSFSNFVGVNDRMQLVPGTAALWLRRTFYGIGE
ncbi:hypothetical protein HBH56_072710 [Parastagonospora nodorum]|nr:hypothetical protein HBH56_072710 [Parastagonospora nodorum]KAH3927254.1 hypothetical protein HBH54_152950 [Parastagonospora nodorum]KAH4139152.1 hypothetical protein HBH45_102050 [Parastagonospora nodorum]KAH4166720.1 hypothetical protein HBH44_063210 [Parastagonospora nodorum]KAH4173984.1 hypothetical protein HBH43_085660 [Parastagonospora nodorum]